MTYNPNWIPFRSEQECRECLQICGPGQMEWERRTGRTVRQLKKAYDAASRGELVFFVVPFGRMKEYAKHEVLGFFGDIPKTLTIVNVPPTADFEHNVRMKTAGASRRQVFFDHYFWECLDVYYSRQFSGK